MASRNIVVILLFCATARSQNTLDSCILSLQCGKASGLYQQIGEAPMDCNCDDIEPLKAELEEVKRRLDRAEAAINPKTCDDVFPRYENEGAVYTIYPVPGQRRGLEVYCDWPTDGPGWTVIQKREDGSVNFTRGWDDYVKGFGKADGEYWLGLENMHVITGDGGYEMRIDMEDFEDNITYSAYASWSVGPANGYAITWHGQSGPLSNGLMPSGTKFSTYDNDQDTKYPESCAEMYKGGGWFTRCHAGHPNGIYHGGRHKTYGDGVDWYPFRGFYYSLKRISMKVRKV